MATPAEEHMPARLWTLRGLSIHQAGGLSRASRQTTNVIFCVAGGLEIERLSEISARARTYEAPKQTGRKSRQRKPTPFRLAAARAQIADAAPPMPAEPAKAQDLRGSTYYRGLKNDPYYFGGSLL